MDSGAGRRQSIAPSTASPEIDDFLESRPRPKKQKVSIACDTCRAKKIKCDGNQPVCGPCNKRRDATTTCSWIHGSTRPDVQKDHIQRLEQRIKELEQTQAGGPILGSPRPAVSPLDYAEQAGENHRFRHSEVSPNGILGQESHYSSKAGPSLNQTAGHDAARLTDTPTSTFSGATSAMIGPVGEDGHMVGVFGTSSAGNFITKVRQAVGRRMGLPQSKTTPQASEGHGTPTSETERRRPSARNDIDYTLPLRRRADTLMGVYWNAIHPLYPFVDQSELTCQYESMWTSQGLPQDEPEFLCMLNIIFALSCQLDVTSSREERQSSSNIFYQRARVFVDLWKTGTLQTVQSFLLLAQYLQSTNEPHQCWMFIGHAVRTAQSIGLHLPETTADLDSSKGETGRRVWHGCILMDRFIAMTYGRPAMIGRSVAAAVPLPAARENELLPRQAHSPHGHSIASPPSMVDFFIQSLKLYEIMYEILVELYPLSSTTRKVHGNEHESYLGGCKSPSRGLSIMDVDRLLMDWERQLPAHLATTQTGDTPYAALGNLAAENPRIIYLRQSVVLRQRFLHVRLLSLRPVLSTFIASDFDDIGGISTFGSDLSLRLSQQCSVVCVKVAQDAISLVHSNRSTNWATAGLLAAWWYNVLFVYSAATILIVGRLKGSIVSELGEGSILESWQLAMSVLEGYTSFSDSIPKLVATLHVLFDEIPVLFSHHRQFVTMDTGAAEQVTAHSRPQGFLNTTEEPIAPTGTFGPVMWPGGDESLRPLRGSRHSQMDFTASANNIFNDPSSMAFFQGDLSWLNVVPYDL